MAVFVLEHAMFDHIKAPSKVRDLGSHTTNS